MTQFENEIFACHTSTIYKSQSGTTRHLALRRDHRYAPTVQRCRKNSSEADKISGALKPCMLEALFECASCNAEAMLDCTRSPDRHIKVAQRLELPSLYLLSNPAVVEGIAACMSGGRFSKEKNCFRNAGGRTTPTASTVIADISFTLRDLLQELYVHAIPTDMYPGVLADCFCAGVSDSQFNMAVIKENLLDISNVTEDMIFAFCSPSKYSEHRVVSQNWWCFTALLCSLVSSKHLRSVLAFCTSSLVGVTDRSHWHGTRKSACARHEFRPKLLEAEATHRSNRQCPSLLEAQCMG